MIRGVVNANSFPVVSLPLRGPGGAELFVEAVIDTGFTGALTLPQEVVAELGLRRQSRSRAYLANGSLQRYSQYQAEVRWGVTWTTILVAAIGDEALLGMQLLRGNRLTVDAVVGGAVEIGPLRGPG